MGCGYSLSGAHKGALVRHHPEFNADAGVGEGHDGDGEDEDEAEHAQLVHVAVHRACPLLDAPVRLDTYPHLLVHLK